MLKLVLPTFCLILMTPVLSAQTYRFEIFSSGEWVGTLEAIREINDEAEKISISIDIKLPGPDYHYGFKSYSSYMNGKLIDVISTKTENDLVTESQTTFKNDSYIAITDGKERTIDTLYGTDLLYFEQPLGFEDVYLLAENAIVGIREIAGNQWQITVGKRKLTYVYRDGILTSMVWKYPDKELFFKLKK